MGDETCEIKMWTEYQRKERINNRQITSLQKRWSRINAYKDSDGGNNDLIAMVLDHVVVPIQATTGLDLFPSRPIIQEDGQWVLAIVTTWK